MGVALNGSGIHKARRSMAPVDHRVHMPAGMPWIFDYRFLSVITMQIMDRIKVVGLAQQHLHISKADASH
jgi:hypothetical protein